MKFNFKKITSVLASAVMLTSTAGMALAANYPTPFVQDSSATGAIVVTSGSHTGAAVDMDAAISLQSALNSQVSSTAGSSSVSGGDSVKIEKPSTKFQLGKGTTDIKSTSLTDSDLPTLLADGTYIDNDNDEFDYTQKIDMENLSLTMWEDNDYKDDEPTVGFRIASGGAILNYTLDFSSNPLWTDLSSSEIHFMGKNYYVLSNDAPGTNSSLTLLDSAEEAILAEDESATIDGKEVSVNFIASNKTILTIDGDNTNSLATGQTQKLNDGSYVGIKDILYSSKTGTISKVEFSIGSGKLELKNATNVKMNDDSVSDLNTYFFGQEKLSKIVLEWKAQEDTFITTDSSPLMQGFEAVRLSFGGMVYPAEETIEIENDGDESLKLEDFPLKDGAVDINILYTNSSHFTIVGKDADSGLITAPITGQAGSGTQAANITFDADVHDYFVLSWNDGNDAESYLMRATSFTEDTTPSPSKNYTDFEYMKNGEWTDTASDKEVGDTFIIGNAEVLVGPINKKEKTVELEPKGNSNFGTLYSKEGLQLYLPWINNTAVDLGTTNYSTTITACAGGGVADTFQSVVGQVGYNKSVTFNLSDGNGNASSASTVCNDYNSTWNLFTVEEDKNENIGAGATNITIQVGNDSDKDLQIKDVVGETATLTEIQDTDVWRSFMYTPLATEILWDKGGDDDAPVKLIYHGGESYGEFYVTAPDASLVSDDEEGQIRVVTDDEVSSVSSKNLVVVGGSCINRAAAEVIGVSYPTCGEDFTAATGVGASQYIIKAVTSPYNEDKVAVLVAGYEAAQTTSAAGKLKEDHATDVGTENIYPVSSA